MKKILLLILLFVGFLNIQAQEIKWLSLEEALVKQKKNPKPIFMDVYTEWCGPCVLLDKQTFNDPKVVAIISSKFYPVKFNAEGNFTLTYKGVTYDNPGFNPERKGRNSAHEFTKLLKVQGYPSMYIIDENGEVNESAIVGYRTADELLKELK